MKIKAVVFCVSGALGLLPSLAQTIPSTTPAPSAQSKPPVEESLRDFNQTDFRLAYDILVGDSQFNRALIVARAAVRHAPNDSAWRLRLAKVAEWLGLADLAAEQWQAIYALGDRSDETLAALRRLGATLTDPSIALQAWTYLAQRTALTNAQWEEIFRLYENTSNPVRGSKWFEAQYRQKKKPLLLDYAARLALNSGDDARAETLYQERLNVEPFSSEVMFQVVLRLIHRGQNEKALATLKAHATKMPVDAIEFWRLMGELAWDQNEFNSAEPAYRRATQSSVSTRKDWTRLTFLARQREPRAAAELAMQAYQRFDAFDQLMLALNIYAELHDLPAQKRIYLGLTPTQRAYAEQNISFVLDRSRFWQDQKQFDSAGVDLKLAARLNPLDNRVALDTLWFLISTGRVTELSAALRQYSNQARENPDYWLPMAAGYQVTNQPRNAEQWYRMAIKRKPEDAVLLLNYADVLEQMRQVGMADRVRRQAWQLLKNLNPAVTDLKHLSNKPELLAWLQLSLRNQSGDPALRQVQQLALQLRDVAVESADQEPLTNLVLGWTLLKEQLPNARNWIWQRFVRQNSSTAPLFADSLLARELNDRQRMDKLLTTQAKAIPSTSRYDMALALDYVQLALDTAVKGMANEETAEPMYERFRLLAPQHAHYIQARLFSESAGSISRQGLQMQGRWAVTPNFQVTAGWANIAQQSNDPNISDLLTSTDRLDDIGLRWFNQVQDTRLTLTRRTELASVTGLRLRQTGKLEPRVAYDVGVDYRNESLISTPMRAAGYETGIYTGLTYNISKRDYVQVMQRFNRYYTQYDDYLGNGRISEIQLGHRFRTTYPDWRARLFAFDYSFSRDGQISAENLARMPAFLQSGISSGTFTAGSYMIPENSTTYGACLSMGDNLAGQQLQTIYSRAWRPFMDVCLQQNSLIGSGYSTLLGFAGSIFGNDHMVIRWDNSADTAPGSSGVNIFSARYRHYF